MTRPTTQLTWTLAILIAGLTSSEALARQGKKSNFGQMNFSNRTISNLSSKTTNGSMKQNPTSATSNSRSSLSNLSRSSYASASNATMKKAKQSMPGSAPGNLTTRSAMTIRTLQAPFGNNFSGRKTSPISSALTTNQAKALRGKSLPSVGMPANLGNSSRNLIGSSSQSPGRLNAASPINTIRTNPIANIGNVAGRRIDASRITLPGNFGGGAMTSPGRLKAPGPVNTIRANPISNSPNLGNLSGRAIDPSQIRVSDPGRLGNLIGRGSTAGDKDGATMPGTWQGGSPFETTPMPRDMGSGEPIGEGDINLPPPQSDDPPVDEPPVEDAGEPDDVPPSCPPPKCPPPSCGLPPICLPPICPPSNCSPPVGGGCLPTGPVSPCDDLPVDDLPVEEMPIDELPSEGESAEAGAEMSRIVPGYEITIAGEGFGLEPGAVQIAIAGLSLPLQVIAWTESEIRAVVPGVGVTEPTPVRLTVQGAAGEVLYEADVQLVPAPVSTE